MGSIAQPPRSDARPPAALRAHEPPVFRRDFAYPERKTTATTATTAATTTPTATRSRKRTSMAKRSPDFAECAIAPVSLGTRTVLADLHSSHRLLSGPTITVSVGPDSHQWTLHLRLLQQHSPHFRNTTSGETRSLDFPHDDARGFGLLVTWLYQGTLKPSHDISTPEQKYDYAVACHKLHLLATSFGIKSLAGLAFNEYRWCLHTTQLVPNAEETDHIYRSSPKQSPFRRLMTRIAARQIMDPDSDKDAAAYRKCFDGDPDFAVEMVNAIRNMSGGILFPDPTAPDAEANGQSPGPLTNGAGEPAAAVATPERKANQARQRAVSMSTRSVQSTPRTPKDDTSQLQAPNNTPGTGKKPVPQRRAVTQPPKLRDGSRKFPLQSPQTSVMNQTDARNSPRAMPNGVNGIVNKLNSLSMASSVSGTESQTAASEAGRSAKRKAPPKLRRGSLSTSG